MRFWQGTWGAHRDWDRGHRRLIAGRGAAAAAAAALRRVASSGAEVIDGRAAHRHAADVTYGRPAERQPSKWTRGKWKSDSRVQRKTTNARLCHEEEAHDLFF